MKCRPLQSCCRFGWPLGKAWREFLNFHRERLRFSAFNSRASTERARVSRSKEYRQRAADCLNLAKRAKEEWAKALLLEMAQAWINLAVKAESEEPQESKH
jgi:hypothetical protein